MTEILLSEKEIAKLLQLLNKSASMLQSQIDRTKPGSETYSEERHACLKKAYFMKMQTINKLRRARLELRTNMGVGRMDLTLVELQKLEGMWLKSINQCVTEQKPVWRRNVMRLSLKSAVRLV